MIKDIRQRLKSAGIENPDLEARWIMKQVLGVSDADIIAGTIKPLSQIQNQKIGEFLNRRIEGEPLSRIFGEKEFWGLNFKIGPATLDPRPDTETLVEIVLKKFHVKQKTAEILDLGTGSGCILISLLKEMPYASGVGVDLSFEACKISIHNANSLGVADRFKMVCGSWSEALAGQKFDLVVSNPPYINRRDIPNLEKEVRNHDPILALDGGPDGLEAYKIIFSELPGLLKPGGKAFFEMGLNQQEGIVRLAEESRIRIECIYPDLSGRPRVVEISCGDK
jgi:release factor glutamine methyltransferase